MKRRRNQRAYNDVQINQKQKKKIVYFKQNLIKLHLSQKNENQHTNTSLSVLGCKFLLFHLLCNPQNMV